jgi:hypothetical protein
MLLGGYHKLKLFMQFSLLGPGSVLHAFLNEFNVVGEYVVTGDSVVTLGLVVRGGAVFIVGVVATGDAVVIVGPVVTGSAEVDSSTDSVSPGVKPSR